MADLKFEFQIPNTNDADWLTRGRQAFEVFSAIDSMSGSQFTVTAPGLPNTAITEENFEEVFDRLDAASGRFVSQIKLHAQLPIAQAQRQNNNQQRPSIALIASRQSGVPGPLAKLEISTTHLQHSDVDQLELITQLTPIKEIWGVIDPSEATLTFQSPETVEYLKALEAQLKSFASIADQQTNLVTEALRKQAVENEESRKTLQGNLEAEYQDRHSALDQREKELDLADSKTARRKIRESLKTKLDQLSKNLKSTEETRSDRRWFFGFIIVGLLTFAGITGEAGYAVAQNSANYFAIFRMVASSVLFSGILIFALKWQASWIANRTQEELRLLNTSLDIERASWVLESLIELRTEDVQDMPTELLEAVTRNLFSDSAQGVEPTTPLGELADILQQGAKSVKIKLGDNEIELDASALKKIIKASKKAEANSAAST